MATEMENAYGAAAGRQAKIKGGGAENDKSLNETTLLEDVALTEGTYFYRIPTAGSATLHAVLKPSAVTGTVMNSLYATLADGITQKGTAVGFTAPSGTTQVVGETLTLAGERYWMLKIIVGTGASVTFSQAEYTTL